MLLSAGLLLVAGIGMRGWIVDRMLFLPAPGVERTPEQLGIAAEEVFLTTEDGVRIHAFALPAPGATRAILYLHGNAGNASHRLPIGALLAGLRADVLLLDYRGYGRSEGRPDEAGVYADARAGLGYLTLQRGLPERRVVLFGSSLGGAVAVDLAQQRRVAGVVLESTWSTLEDTAAKAFGPIARPFTRGRFDSLSKIGRLRSPLLSLHGDRDDIVPIALGRRLFDAAPGPKQFATLAGAGHNDTLLVGGEAYLARLQRFLDEVAP
jgi:pimeloyl-ACP methyl ester carboxylesterase